MRAGRDKQRLPMVFNPQNWPFPVADMDSHSRANPISPQNGISIGSAVFAGLTNVNNTDRQTD